MREIKFRAWDKLHGVMLNKIKVMHFDTSDDGIEQVYGYNSYKAKGHEGWAALGNVSIMQFTGLKDKNGTEIYEGDILRNDKSREIFECVYDVEMASFEGIDRTREKIGGVVFGPTFFPLRGTIEIIGNLWENPDLLAV
jgi:uncharacterized phage protein (TIGR01671 family)